MDISPSATTINNIILNLNFQVVLNLAVYAFFIAASATSASKIIILLVQKLLELLHQKYLARFKDRKNLALEIIKICNEGSTTGWNVKPRDIEHVYYIARLLKIEDENASKLFDQCISNWSLNGIRQDHTEATKENLEFSIKLQNEAQEASEKLIELVGKWIKS